MATYSKKNLPMTMGWVICGLGALFYCYEYLLRIEPSVMVTPLMRHFQIHAEQFGFLVSMYYMAYTPMQLVVGTMTDLYGARKILTTALACCVLGSSLFTISSSLYIAASGRFLIGFGSAFAFVGVLKLASIWLPQRHFALFAGIATALGMIGGMFGDIELAWLVNHSGYRTTLIYTTIAGVILLPIIWLLVRDHPDDKKPVTPLNHKYRETFQSLWNIIKNPQMWICGIIGCTLFLSLSVFAELWGNPFIELAYKVNSQQAANLIAMVFMGWLIGAPFIGWFSDKIKKRRILLLTGDIVATIIFIVILYAIPANILLLRILLFTFGFFCSVQILCFATGKELCPPHMAGSAVALINMIVMLGGFLLQPLVGVLLDWDWSGTTATDGSRLYSIGDYHIALSLLPACLVISALLCTLLKESYNTKEQRELW